MFAVTLIADMRADIDFCRSGPGADIRSLGRPRRRGRRAPDQSGLPQPPARHRHATRRAGRSAPAGIERARLGRLNVYDGERDSALQGRLDNPRDAHRSIETNERVAGAKHVVEGAAIREPDVWCSAAGDVDNAKPRIV